MGTKILLCNLGYIMLGKHLDQNQEININNKNNKKKCKKNIRYLIILWLKIYNNHKKE
jgi:hypothetical protein